MTEKSQHSKRRIRRSEYINPLVIEDSLRTVLESVNRLLEYERFLDRMETTKADLGELPIQVERRILRAARRAEADAIKLAKATLDLFNEYQDSRTLDEFFADLALELEARGKMQFDEVWEQSMPELEDFAVKRGLKKDLWNWALSYQDFSGVTLTGEKGNIVGMLKERRAVLVPQNPSYIPTIESSSFVDGEFFRRAVTDHKAIIDGIPHFSPYAVVLILLKNLLERYEQRTSAMALHGVQVLPTGIDPFTIFIIVVIVVVIIAVVVGLLCESGTFSKEVCIITLLLLGGALFLMCLFGGGETGLGKGGVTCTMIFNGEEAPTG